MSNELTKFQSGQSGNPRGRPPGQRALAATLREMAQQFEGDEEISIGEAMSRLIYRALLSGDIALTSGRRLELDAKQWLDLMKWLHHHVDGSVTVQEIAKNEQPVIEKPRPNISVNIEPFMKHEEHEAYAAWLRSDDPVAVAWRARYSASESIIAHHEEYAQKYAQTYRRDEEQETDEYES